MSNVINRFLSRHLETVLTLAGRRLYENHLKSTKKTNKVQEAVLKEILSYAADTHFGKKHGFAKIKNYPDFVSSVKVHDYEDLRPYVERHTKGEKNVLFPGKPLMYSCSSGTTAEPKLIPVTRYNFKRTIKNRGKRWLYGLMKNYDGIFKGKDLALVSPAIEGYTDDNTPYGSLSGLIYQNIPEFMKLVHSIPYSVITIGNYDAKVYTLLRFALAEDITVIMTGNPSTVLNMAVMADKQKQDLIRDIHDGTLKSEIEIDPKIRSEIEERITSDPNRSAQLEKIAGDSELFCPKNYWPNLKLVHTWKNGNCRIVIPKLEKWFGDIPVLDFGYLATEVQATDVVFPHNDGSLLQIQNAFYEFSPLTDGDNRPRKFYLAHELEKNKRYYIYVTTFSGLYRYDMNDIVEVIDHYNSAPVLRFLFKGKGITSVRGEKLSEEQLLQALEKAVTLTGVKHEFFIAYADAEKGEYSLYIDIGKNSPDEIKKFEKVVDEVLCEVNIEYKAKRESQRLLPLKIIDAGENFFDRYTKLRIDEGAHDGQMKWLHLSSAKITLSRMKRLTGK